ncbi:MAG TPA: SMP-30/gluconolactonase/LRE family protein [Polyangia bacterium]|jgi:gluconolactonase|nr:SMP-30/gluconolactonase/LRE family protein [Polyangia bacterium]
MKVLWRGSVVWLACLLACSSGASVKVDGGHDAAAGVGSGGASDASAGVSGGISGASGGQSSASAGASAGASGASPSDAAPAADASDARGDALASKQATCPAGPFPTPMGTDRQAVCATFKLNHNWNEGPVWIASQGAFFFSNFELDATTNYDGDIIKYTPATGTCELWLANVGTNGMGVAPDGNLLAAVNVTQSITEFDLATKQPKIIVDHYMGKKFNAPNDLIVHTNGTIYFTDPDYQRGNRPQELPLAVYRIDPEGALSIVETGDEPNGITLSPDERRLYVDLDKAGGLGVFDLDADGVPTGAARPFAGVTDGVAMDCAGNLYLSADGGIVSAAGTPLGTIPGGGGTHPTFGGVDGKTLFVVGDGSVLAQATSIATVQMNLPGIQ